MTYGDMVTTLTGNSGKQYMFNIHPRSTTFQAKPVVYVMAREHAGVLVVGMRGEVHHAAERAGVEQCLLERDDAAFVEVGRRIAGANHARREHHGEGDDGRETHHGDGATEGASARTASTGVPWNMRVTSAPASSSSV